MKYIKYGVFHDKWGGFSSSLFSPEYTKAMWASTATAKLQWSTESGGSATGESEISELSKKQNYSSGWRQKSKG